MYPTPDVGIAFHALLLIPPPHVVFGQELVSIGPYTVETRLGGCNAMLTDMLILIPEVACDAI